MSRLLSKCTAVLALAAFVPAQAATPPVCVTRAEARGLMAYLAPVAIHRLGESCAPHSSANGFFRTGVSDLEQRYAAGRDAAWPMARSAITKFAGDQMSSIDIRKLSDAAVRPLADEIIADKLKLTLTPADCSVAEEIVEAVSAIEPGATLNLITAILGIVARKDKDMPICPREA